MSTVDDLQAQINQLNNLKQVLRQREANLDARNQYLQNPGSFPVNTVANLRDTLQGALPSYLVPGNVGGINEVTWPFLFQVNIDMGTNPVIQNNNIQKDFFQVDQEAALLLMAISRAHSTDAAGASATVLAPLQIDLIDRQSSRHFSSSPIPLQTVGYNSRPSIFPTPYFLYENAFLDVVTNGIPALPQNFNGSGAFQLSFFGYRIRTEDTGKVLATIFQSMPAM